MNSFQFSELLDIMGTPFSDVVVMKEHKVIYRHFAGFSDTEQKERTTGKELYFLYSCSKVMTCASAMKLIEEGRLSPDDPVSKYLPEYASLKVMQDGQAVPCKNTLTVRHLFTMTGGFDYDLNAPAIRRVKAETSDKASTRELVAAMAEKPLLFEPGTHFQYSLCHDILAAVVEVISGMTFGEFLKQSFWEPLGMKNTFIKRPNEETLSRISAQYRFENGKYVPVPKTCAYQLSDNYESGGAGIISSVDDYILFLDAMANGGTGANGAQILKPETINLMRTPQLSPECFKDYQTKCANKEGYSYAFGVRVHTDVSKSHSLSPLGEFGWDGAAGSYALIDPESKLSLFYAQHVLGHGPIYNSFHHIVRNAAYEV